MHIEAMSWSPDGKTIAVSRYVDQPGVILFDVASGQSRTLTIPDTGLIHDVAFSPDNKTLAVRHEGVGIILWELPAGKEWTRLDKKKIGHGRGLSFSADGTTLAVMCQEMEPYGTVPAGIQMWD